MSKLDKSLDKVAKSLEPDVAREDLPALALGLALDSYASKLACQRVLELMAEDRKQPTDDKKKK